MILKRLPPKTPFIASLLLLLVSFSIPEFYTAADAPQWLTKGSRSTIEIFLLLAVACAGSLNIRSTRIILIYLWLAQATQVIHASYFGRFYSGPDIKLVSVEIYDILTSMLGMWQIFFPALLLSLIPIGVLLILPKTAPVTKMNRIMAGLAIFIIIFHVTRTYTMSVEKNAPDFRNLAVFNGMNAAVNYTTKFMLKQPMPSESFEPYSTEKLPQKTGTEQLRPNIIMIVGESINPHHMSLFGYERDTTPQLQQLSEEWNGQAKVITSSGVITRISTPMLFAVSREPKNSARYRTRTGHLVSTAKEQGYQTILVSTQVLDFISSFAVMEDYDTYVDFQTKRDLSDKNYAQYLQQVEVKADQPYFFIMNIRAPHSPYAENIHDEQKLYSTSEAETLHDNINNTYDDSLRTADTVLSQGLRNIIAKNERPTLVLLTSDHGQNMGENGYFGHGRLDRATAEVPLVQYQINWPENVPSPDIECIENHYMLGKHILKQMGIRLINPNEKNGEYFINGNNIYGNDGELPYQVAPCNE